MLDLTDPALLKKLRLARADLTSDDRASCQELAELAIAAGFEAVLGPSAAGPGERTLAVFGSAISRAEEVVDLGVRSAPS